MTTFDDDPLLMTLVRIDRLSPASAQGQRVELPMTAEDRQRVRRRIVASDGQELALALPTGTVLHVGAVLFQTEAKAYIVTAAAEDTLVVRPRTMQEAARVGHLVGNLHRDMDVTDDVLDNELVTLWTGALEARLRKEGFAVTREQRPFGGRPPGEHSHGSESRNLETQMAAMLPPRYQEQAASPAPMRSAGLVYDDAGGVAWNQMWGSFCDLALAGGPTHRGTLLEPPTADEVRAEPEAYEKVVAELERAVPLVTGLETVKSAHSGWVGVRCRDEAMAIWLLRAIVVENVLVRRQGSVLFLPAGPEYRLEQEIKNVVTALAKTHHYFTEHLNG